MMGTKVVSTAVDETLSIKLTPFDKVAATFGFEVLFLFPPLPEPTASFDLPKLRSSFLEVIAKHYMYMLNGKLFFHTETTDIFIQNRSKDDPQPKLIEIDDMVADIDITEAIKTMPYDLIPPRVTEELVTVKCTLLRDGALAIGVNMNHGVMDAVGCFVLMKTWGQYYRGEIDDQLVICHERSLLYSKGVGSCREHIEYRPVPPPSSAPPADTPPMQFPKTNHCVVHLSTEELKQLKAFVVESADPSDDIISTLDVVTALTSVLVTQARGHKQDVNIGQVINIRTRTEPPLPANFTGNGASIGRSTHPAADFVNSVDGAAATLKQMAQRIRASIRKVDGPYLADRLELLDSKRMQLNFDAFFGPDIFFSSWLNLGASEVDFGTRPWLASPPTVPLMDGFVYVLDGIAQSNGIGLLVYLEENALKNFEMLWAKHVPSCWQRP